MKSSTLFFIIVLVFFFFVPHDLHKLAMAIFAIVISYHLIYKRSMSRWLRATCIILLTITLAQLCMVSRDMILHGLSQAPKAHKSGQIIGDVVYGFRKASTDFVKSFTCFHRAFAHNEYRLFEELNLRLTVCAWSSVVLTLGLVFEWMKEKYKRRMNYAK